jgi:hypothetical protein
MKIKLFLAIAALMIFSQTAAAQNAPTETTADLSRGIRIEELTVELKSISKALTTFNGRLNEFLDSLNKYKGIQISEHQQRLLFGYEILNQTEQLAATLRKSLIETGEKEATLRRRIGQLEIDLRPENIERSISTRGTTKAEEARDGRRRMLEDERNALQNVLTEIVKSRAQLTQDLRQTELFAENYRRSLMSLISNELSKF